MWLYLDNIEFTKGASLVTQDGKESTCIVGDLGSNPQVGKIPGKRTWRPSSELLPGESPWKEEPGGLQSMGSQRVGCD